MQEEKAWKRNEGVSNSDIIQHCYSLQALSKERKGNHTPQNTTKEGTKNIPNFGLSFVIFSHPIQCLPLHASSSSTEGRQEVPCFPPQPVFGYFPILDKASFQDLWTAPWHKVAKKTEVIKNATDFFISVWIRNEICKMCKSSNCYAPFNGHSIVSHIHPHPPKCNAVTSVRMRSNWLFTRKGCRKKIYTKEYLHLFLPIIEIPKYFLEWYWYQFQRIKTEDSLFIVMGWVEKINVSWKFILRW